MATPVQHTTTLAAPLPFELALAGPLDVPASLERLRRWGDDLLDRWDGQTLVRTTTWQGATIPYACAPTGTLQQPKLAVTIRDARERPAVEAALRALFIVPEGDPLEALVALAARDPAVARLVIAFPGVRGLRQTDGLAALVRAISAQQVNLTWAATTRRRLAELVGVRHSVGAHEVYALDAARLARATVADLRALQFTTRKAEYLITVAQGVADGSLDLAALATAPDADVITRLVAVRGLGRWTAEWYLARVLGRPVVVAGDLGVRKAVGAMYLDGAMPTEARVRELTAHWGAAAAVAQELALHALGEGYAFTAG
jgi:DNA-3-methyladenine glycosylase II